MGTPTTFYEGPGSCPGSYSYAPCSPRSCPVHRSCSRFIRSGPVGHNFGTGDSGNAFRFQTSRGHDQETNDMIA